MKHSILIILLLVFVNCFSQDLEEAIYVTTETFTTNPNPSTFKTLVEKEASFKANLKSEDQYFAYLDLLVKKGYYLFKNNKQTQAITTYENAWTIYKTKIEGVFKYDITEHCLKNLSTLYNKIGDYTNAENTIKQYIFLAEKENNNKHRISGAINLAQLYYTIGKHQSANTIIENGLKIKGISNTQKQKLIQINLNIQIDLKQISSTKDIPTRKQIEAYKANTLEANYNVAVKNNNFEEALLNLKKLITKTNSEKKIDIRKLAKLHVKNAEAHYKLAHFEASLLDLKAAINFLIPNYKSKSIPNKEDLYADNTFIDIFDLLALLQPNTNNALACYDRSFYVSDLLQNSITSQEAKLIHLNANRKRSEACINLLFEDFKATKDSLLIKQAFTYAEKNKASILKETINKKSLLERFPKDSLLIKEDALSQKQERLTNNLIKAQYKKDSKQIDLLSKQLTSTSINLKQLKKEIEAKYPNDINQTVSVTSIQDKLLKDNAILVEYFYGENAVYLFLISATTVDCIRIEKDEKLEVTIANYIDYFNNSSVINNNIPKFTNDAFELYNLIGFSNTSTYKNVVVIPDGFLSFIPFESLLSEKTTTKSYSKMPFVAKNQMLSYNTSALFYLNNSPFKYSNSVLGVFPVFNNTNSKLTYSVNEAESIEKETDAKFLMHQSATKKDALTQANQFGVLHLSTHANSGTFTIPANIDFIDEKLYLNELYSLNLNNNLVVLSACETGIGKLQKGEGSMNLARGFQYAGVENLLFSLWKINDLSTSQLMSSFYKNYSKTQSAFIANHLSKIDYLKDKNISNIKKSPYYWSAFIYYGDLTASKPKSNSKYIIFTFIGLGIALLLWLVIRKLKNGQYT
ncbi:CHAT domain-containing protein [Olleya sp. R77988]|uniref:CHAT domain-containing protein n=1 Tax=Olleya sp. R77988 TaxID=3093875 RepID=UPI0037C540DA